ncbi:hypothetical protein [Polyangium spumosum]|uniref:Uncharacterized protein n=1 Tax=Polyangium spumosum TaxID=889282 RepID=A0A6N7PMP4_9BACT|nr:hypothetical protein [Polyangium spumosum]MRG93353.1 hypothetical protein [Polyangium spumosum]
MSLSARKTLLVGLTASIVGCLGDGKVDPHHPGEPLGTYQVAATRETNTCGEGALGSTATWQFQVRLSRGDGELFWDSGAEVTSGTLGADERRFSFDTQVAVDMRAGETKGPLPPCAVVRGDRAEGLLDEDAGGFTGELAYTFTPSEGSDCADLVTGPEPAFAALPCMMSYVLDAERIVAPR